MLGLLRIVTNPRIYLSGATIARAWSQAEASLACPNVLMGGLRGVGKTVLLERMRSEGEASGAAAGVGAKGEEAGRHPTCFLISGKPTKADKPLRRKSEISLDFQGRSFTVAVRIRHRVRRRGVRPLSLAENSRPEGRA